MDGHDGGWRSTSWAGRKVRGLHCRLAEFICFEASYHIPIDLSCFDGQI